MIAAAESLESFGVRLIRLSSPFSDRETGHNRMICLSTVRLRLWQVLQWWVPTALDPVGSGMENGSIIMAVVIHIQAVAGCSSLGGNALDA